MNIQGMKFEEVMDCFMNGFQRRNPGEENFHQAVRELAADVIPFMIATPRYARMNILERLTEPDRIISFRVNWRDDENNVAPIVVTVFSTIILLAPIKADFVSTRTLPLIL
ncbi:hypothetical protein [Parendozoicomonas sp. Alg238-R29]|uniref:hypothetical protein n=1 Tax=Parendozoicomonas sp. Alg238-R29 TaxID=2993446 RepID=UPI00248D8DA3|nr:hypothetical protein [Parendozoicomonas sp. Alg238-R29]